MTSTKYVYRKDYGQTKLFDDFTYSLEEAQRMFDKEHDINEEYPDGVQARPPPPSFCELDIHRSHRESCRYSSSFLIDHDPDIYRPRYPEEES